MTMVPYSDTTSPRPSEHFVDASPSGSVILISSPPQARSSSWGGLMTLGAKGRGVKGVVVLGNVRDLAEHRQEEFPVSPWRGGRRTGGGERQAQRGVSAWS